MGKVKSLATLAKEMRKLRKKPTQEGVKFSKNKDIVMPKDTDIKLSTVSGTKGVTGKGEVINVGDDAVGFSNFLALQKSKGIFKREKAMRALEKIIDKGTATQKKQARDMLSKMKETKKKSDAEATGNQQRGRRGKSTKTIAKSDDPFFRALEEAKKDGVLGKDYEKLLPKQKEQIVQAAKAFKKSEFEKDVRAKLDAPKNAPISTGSAVENKRKIGMNKGGLKMPTGDQVGLKKLPTPVRNKMGYMYGGGMMKKPRMSSMDYRKGGLLLIAIDMMKKKNKKGKK
tara:strand:- start:123 stop:977 length:855 start_codon:yes stop_codon:yes gene_type:complete